MKKDQRGWSIRVLGMIVTLALASIACQFTAQINTRGSEVLLQRFNPSEPVIPVTSVTEGRPEPVVCLESSLTYSQLMKRGASVYDGDCRGCHGIEGQGTPDGFYPALGGSGITQSKDAQMPIDWLMTTDIHPVASRLSEKDVASVITYIRNSFGNHASVVCPEDVILRLIP